MSTSVELHGSQAVWEAPPSEPLDEAVWQAWEAKNRARDRRDSAAYMKAVKWVSIAGLAVAGLWSQLTQPYEVALRFVVTAGAMVVMFQALRARHYAVAVVFAALAVLYNPVAPVFSFSGDWQRGVLAASAIPFVASLAWRKVTAAHND